MKIKVRISLAKTAGAFLFIFAVCIFCTYAEGAFLGVLYTSRGCSECMVVEKRLKEVGVLVEVKDIGDDGVLKELAETAERFGKRAQVPALLAGDRFVVGKDDILKMCEGHEMGEGVKESAFRTKGFFWTVAVAGLVDGVNPCALSALFLMLALLAHLEGSKKRLVQAGVCWAASSFICYFLIGAGLIKIVGYVNEIKALAIVVYLLGICACFYMLAVNTADYLRVESGGAKKAKNRLGVKRADRLRKWVRNEVSERGAVVSGAILGAVSSFIEFPCTGQVYVPVIMIMFDKGARGFAYLVLYNAMFVVPILAVTFLVYLKSSTVEVAGKFYGNLGKVKIGTNIIYIVVIVYLANMVFEIVG